MAAIGYPRLNQSAWLAVALLAVLSVISYVDRLVLSLLVEPLKADLVLTDTQIGLLVGTSFAIFYTLFGLPLGRIADRTSRRNLIFAGALLWNVMTVASAFAESFASLMFLRLGVALGEAALTPAALSMIADLFRREKRSLPTSLFVGVGATGAAGALLIGAAGMQLVSSSLVATLPFIGGMAAWRLTLIFLGASGALVAFLFLALVREPHRVTQVPERQTPVRELLHHLWRNAKAYAALFGIVSLNAMLTFGVLSWYPTHLVRTYGMSIAEAGYTFGLIGVIATVIGAIGIPAMADRVNRNGRYDGFVWAAMAAMVILAPLLIVSLSAPTAGMSLTFAAPAFLLMLGVGIMCTSTLALLPPGHLRAQTTAVYLLVANAVGLALGPLLIALLSDQLFDGPRGLGRAIVALVFIVGPCEILLLLWARRGFANSLRAATKEEQAVLASASPARTV